MKCLVTLQSNSSLCAPELFPQGTRVLPKGVRGSQGLEALILSPSCHAAVQAGGELTSLLAGEKHVGWRAIGPRSAGRTGLRLCPQSSPEEGDGDQ